MQDNLLNLKDTAPVTGFICDQWIERRATIEGLKRGEFETLMPILKSLVVITPEEKLKYLMPGSKVVCQIIQNYIVKP